MSTGILACSALSAHVRAAQEAMGTSFPVFEIDRNYHDRPKRLRGMIEDAFQALPEGMDTVLVAMGACGNCWDGMSWNRRLVFPKADDCVTILLYTGGEWRPNRKEMGHFYQFERDENRFSLAVSYEELLRRHGEKRAARIFQRMFGQYAHVDIVDTGVFDCREASFAARLRREADLIHASLSYVRGSNLLLEKLVSGDWDEQFLILEPGTVIDGGAFLH